VSTMRRFAIGIAAGAVALAFAAGGAAAVPKTPAGSSGVRLVRVGTFTQPLYATSPPGDTRRLMVVEQRGRIMVVRDGRKLGTPFLDIRSRVLYGGEQGLLSVAFPPDYARTRRFYVYYTAKNGTTNRIVEFRRSRSNPDRADPSSARTVLAMPNLEANHNGGLMLFRPDGLLYIGTGDGGAGNDPHGPIGNAQNLGVLLGKLLRIDPRPSGRRAYTIPRSNPFVGRAGARGEIYSYGLRNPWRFSFDARTGDLIIGDVGQGIVEEIDYMLRGHASGVNFGWRVWEGRRKNFPAETARGAVFPVIQHTHAEGFCSITGGYVVRDPALRALSGRYVYSDACDSQIRVTRLQRGNAPAGTPLALPKLSTVVSFGEDARQRVYVVSLDGPVYRLAAAR
jgi:glucose/arabinose dehydrogenase